MKNLLFLLLFLMLFSACVPSPEPVASPTVSANIVHTDNWTKTPAPTTTPTATNTLTPVPPKIRLLDAFFFDTFDKASTSKVVLERDQQYWVILSGTYSHWFSEQWSKYGVCWGTAEPLPMFPSPNRKNGQVGADPYYRFAHPNRVGDCENGKTQGTPGPLNEVLISLDGGAHFAAFIPTIQQYREDHTYIYAVKGQGDQLIIRHGDSYLDDNYGQIFIVIEEIN